MPTVGPSWLGWCEHYRALLQFPTCYEIGRDGEATHHTGVFQNGPISLQLPVLHMQSRQLLVQWDESVSKQPWDSKLLDGFLLPNSVW